MVGLDVGTMNLITAQLDSSDSIIYNNVRNAFIKVDDNVISAVDLSNISHAFIDGDLFILGKDAYNFANIFGKTINRPMSKGLISPDEIDAVDVLSALLSSILPNDPDNNSPICVYSCPSNSTDADNDIIYHKSALNRIISTFNYNPISLNEALAIIYSNCSETGFTGLAISFGAGMTNVCLAYKSVPVCEFSLERGGDWIDKNVSLAVNVLPNRVCAIKEKKDFHIVDYTRNCKKKKEKRIREALSYYYQELIKYSCSQTIEQLSRLHENIELPDELPIILSGGTSLIDGFTELAIPIFKNAELPFDVSDIKHAVDPLNAVSHGCLVKALTLK